MPTDTTFIKAAQKALEIAFRTRSVFARSGGSLPIVANFQKHLAIPSILMGFGLPDDNPHAPNEKFYLPNFYRGIAAVILFFEKAGQLPDSNGEVPWQADVT